jgi:dienelactone hydrolase
MSAVSRRTVLAGSAALAAAGVVTTATATPVGAHPTSGPKPTVVLVHGAFADASGWNDVIRRLVPAGYPVLAPANPLRGVAGDRVVEANASHVAMMSQPELTADLIALAARTTRG